jgi:phosphoribosylaminoimidazole-succinocarboxamide synthase
MKLKYTGKTKNVYELEDGNLLLTLKDDATGKDGVFDPGENTVGLTIEGLGRQSLRMSVFFFNIIRDAGFYTHFIEGDTEAVTMKVRPGSVFGKGVEAICRFRAVGSFYRRYGAYIEEGAKLNAFTEFTLKDDDRNDPPITKQALIELGIMTSAEFDEVDSQTRALSILIKDELAKKDLELYDIKLEFGRSDKGIMLIDEISAGNMRVYKNGVWIQPMELAKIVLGD